MSIFTGPAKRLGNGNTVVTTAGTQVQLTATRTPCAWVIVTAAPANGGNITVGGPDVDATADAESGVTLDALQSVTIPVADLSEVWVDTTNSGDEVGYVYGVLSE